MHSELMLLRGAGKRRRRPELGGEVSEDGAVSLEVVRKSGGGKKGLLRRERKRQLSLIRKYGKGAREFDEEESRFNLERRLPNCKKGEFDSEKEEGS